VLCPAGTGHKILVSVFHGNHAKDNFTGCGTDGDRTTRRISGTRSKGPQRRRLIDARERHNAHGDTAMRSCRESNVDIVGPRIRSNQRPDFDTCPRRTILCADETQSCAVVGDRTDGLTTVGPDGDANQHQTVRSRGRRMRDGGCCATCRTGTRGINRHIQKVGPVILQLLTEGDIRFDAADRVFQVPVTAEGRMSRFVVTGCDVTAAFRSDLVHQLAAIGGCRQIAAIEQQVGVG
jgi:hypothetical protein